MEEWNERNSSLPSSLRSCLISPLILHSLLVGASRRLCRGFARTETRPDEMANGGEMRRDRTAHSRTLPVTYRSSRVTNGTRKESEPSVSSCPSLSLVIHMPFISLTLGPQPMIHPVPSSFVGALVPLSLTSLLSPPERYVRREEWRDGRDGKGAARLSHGVSAPRLVTSPLPSPRSVILPSLISRSGTRHEGAKKLSDECNVGDERG